MYRPSNHIWLGYLGSLCLNPPSALRFCLVTNWSYRKSRAVLYLFLTEMEEGGVAV